MSTPEVAAVGSALAHAFAQIGDEAPDVEEIIGNSIVACCRNTPFFAHFSPSDQRLVLGNSNTVQESSNRGEFEINGGRGVVLEDRSPHYMTPGGPVGLRR